MRRRRTLIWSAVAVSVLLVVACVGLVALLFSSERQGWDDESRVLHTHGTVIDEVSGSGSCKGRDYDTQLEWTEDGQLRTGWARTCASGPDVGDRVEMWVRDDGKITLTEPSATVVFLVLGVVFFLGLGVLSYFSLRSNLRAVNAKLAVSET